MESTDNFKIISCIPLFRMILSIELDNQVKKIPISVDFQNKKVYFEDSFSLSLDYNKLEQKVLESLNLPSIEQPIFDQNAMSRINEIRDGKYGRENLEF